MKKFTIRKHPICGHWLVFKKGEGESLVFFYEIAHCETFGDILVLINLYSVSDGII
jgi:hypothetical protein